MITSVRRNIFKHAENEYPYECCGLVTATGYVRCENVHPDPEHYFEISQDELFKHKNDIHMIVHSHIDNRHASEEDMEGQIRTAVPWGIVNVINGLAMEMNVLGLPLDQYGPFEGRRFVNGVNDCFSLLRCYYKETYQIDIKPYPHSINFWKDENNLIVDNFMAEGFEKLRNGHMIVPGDVLLFQLGHTKVPNHLAIYVGNGLILHHLRDCLSRREPLKNYKDNLVCVLTHKDVKQT